ncbi:hypothetical protein C7402_122124 [Paraburkholderia unamae]|uniref:Uncharacterized protein n=2 Tax=Paraburkholderia unamae TaxID=219649 RepID=A0ABX5KBT8_9BURK|nr:hypothetical protein [Paraburkholderia unamae]PVX73234.1 hypothetical protein C7402_122124 [Paraburkholderia unamae]RAR48196.1 hypothetical protein C7401_15312 [Paraburkholderia unamae]CAG9258363.1 conserved hypothetical protein [Paraburkholderia unamae]
MGPQGLFDTSHLMKHVDALGKSIAHGAHAPPVARPERVVVEFIQRQSAQCIDLGVALGCAAFVMGVVTGMYLLLDRS